MCLGIPGRVVATVDVAGLLMGTADFGGITREVCLAYVPAARIGDYVIVHAGFAISMVDEAEAHRTLEILRSMGDLPPAELPPAELPQPGPAAVSAGRRADQGTDALKYLNE